MASVLLEHALAHALEPHQHRPTEQDQCTAIARELAGFMGSVARASQLA